MVPLFLIVFFCSYRYNIIRMETGVLTVPRIILIGGGSSSGKSYVAKNVIRNIGEENVTHITRDDYYRDQTNRTREERNLVNYDHPKAFDWKLRRKQILDLKNGKTIEKPLYDFKVRNRRKETETIVPRKLIVIEGIMALVDKEVRSMGDLLVFITASPEVRFLRRFIRDHEERGRGYENIVSQYLNTVAPRYSEIIAPSSNYADRIVNNDNVSNHSIEVLTCVFQEELRKAEDPDFKEKEKRNEFSEDILNRVFQQSVKA